MRFTEQMSRENAYKLLESAAYNTSPDIEIFEQISAEVASSLANFKEPTMRMLKLLHTSLWHCLIRIMLLFLSNGCSG